MKSFFLAQNGNSAKVMRLGAVALCAVAMGALTACSSDDSEPASAPTSSQISDPNAISYAVTGINASRASQIYNANNIPSSFYVSAWAVDDDSTTNDAGHTYIKSDFIKNSGSSTAQNWVDQSGLRYWPNQGEMLNFFASNVQAADFTDDLSGKGAASQSDKAQDAHYTIPMTIASQASAQTDMIYAYAYDQKKTATGLDGQTSQAVNLAFHHALSQLVFTGTNTNDHIKVIVNGITVGGLASQGTFKIPAVRPDGGGIWEIASNYTPASFIAADQGDVTVTLGNTATAITSSAAQSPYALMLLPQNVAAADPSESDPWGRQKAYLKVSCLIYNVAKGIDDKGGEVERETMIFGSHTDLGGYLRDDPADLYIPVDLNMQPGKRYVFNLQFGNGNGGYNPDGTTALIPIKYNLTVDNWVEASK